MSHARNQPLLSLSWNVRDSKVNSSTIQFRLLENLTLSFRRWQFFDETIPIFFLETQKSNNSQTTYRIKSQRILTRLQNPIKKSILKYNVKALEGIKLNYELFSSCSRIVSTFYVFCFTSLFRHRLIFFYLPYSYDKKRLWMCFSETLWMLWDDKILMRCGGEENWKRLKEQLKLKGDKRHFNHLWRQQQH